jgi:D-alanyl-D-alanine carboxypeptidase
MPIAAAPPNLRDEMCGPHRKKPASETDDADDDVAANNDKSDGAPMSLRPATPKFSFAALPQLPLGEPVDVFVGTPKQPGQIASGAAPGAKPVAVTPVQTANAGKPIDLKAGAAPAVWTSLTATPLANAPPQTMSSILAETPRTVPLPRPRPAIKPKPQAAKPPVQPPT